MLRTLHRLGGAAVAVAIASAALVAPSSQVAVAATAAILQTPECRQHSLPANDDGSSDAVALPFTINYFGVNYSELWVNNNGNVTFDESQSEYTPYTINADTPPIIAPFFADVDTRGAGTVTWGTTTFQGFRTFCVNWTDVGYFKQQSDLLNTFQLLLVSRTDIGNNAFDVVFNYGQIQWETGSASDGSGGKGGTSAGAGFSNGDGNSDHFFEMAGSLQPGAFLDSTPNGLTHGAAGTNLAGRHMFHIRTANDTGGSVSDLTRAFPTSHIGYSFANQGMDDWRRQTHLGTGDVLTHDYMTRTFADWDSVTQGHFLWWDHSRDGGFFDKMSTAMNGGVCFGLALTGGRFDASLDILKSAAASRSANVWSKSYAFQLPAPGASGSNGTYNKEFLRMTAAHFSTQWSTEVQTSLNRQHDAYHDPTSGFIAFRNQLVSAMRSGKNLYDDSGRTNTALGNGYAGITIQVPRWGGHEVIAYSLKADDDGTLRIGVWDNNLPNQPHTITVRTDGTWAYDANYWSGATSIHNGTGELAALPLFQAKGLHFLASRFDVGQTLGTGAFVDVPAGVTVSATDDSGRPVSSEQVIAGVGVDAGQILNLTSGSGNVTVSGGANPSLNIRGTDAITAANSTSSGPLTVATAPGDAGITVTAGAADLAVAGTTLMATSSGVNKLQVADTGSVVVVGTGQRAAVDVTARVKGSDVTAPIVNGKLAAGATKTITAQAVKNALAAAEKKLHQKLTHRAPHRVTAGKKFKISGNVSTKGGPVQLQELVKRHHHKVWKKVKTAHVKHGKYTFTVKVKAGKHVYRVSRPAVGGYLPATTKKFTVKATQRH